MRRYDFMNESEWFGWVPASDMWNSQYCNITQTEALLCDDYVHVELTIHVPVLWQTAKNYNIVHAQLLYKQTSNTTRQPEVHNFSISEDVAPRRGAECPVTLTNYCSLTFRVLRFAFRDWRFAFWVSYFLGCVLHVALWVSCCRLCCLLASCLSRLASRGLFLLDSCFLLLPSCFLLLASCFSLLASRVLLRVARFLLLASCVLLMASCFSRLASCFFFHVTHNTQNIRSETWTCFFKMWIQNVVDCVDQMHYSAPERGQNSTSKRESD